MKSEHLNDMTMDEKNMLLKFLNPILYKRIKHAKFNEGYDNDIVTSYLCGIIHHDRLNREKIESIKNLDLEEIKTLISL